MTKFEAGYNFGRIGWIRNRVITQNILWLTICRRLMISLSLSLSFALNSSLEKKKLIGKSATQHCLTPGRSYMSCAEPFLSRFTKKFGTRVIHQSVFKLLVLHPPVNLDIFNVYLLSMALIITGCIRQTVLENHPSAAFELLWRVVSYHYFLNRVFLS